MAFDFKAAESTVREFWEKAAIYPKAKAANAGKETFYFLDGPPYTSGKVHIGTAWNKSLKDMVLRFRRMQGRDVWDRAGYDMHGLPTEHATEKELGIQGRNEIEAFGKEKFIDACRSLCVRNMQDMNNVFKSLGVWMDFDNAYQTISKEFMEGAWWLVKKAHENGRLYEGERSMTWDMHAATALAKHELVYQRVTDTSIYVRLKLKDEDAYLIVWTTTPWTIPFNLAVMAHPEIAYCKIRVTFESEDQAWYVAKDLLDDFLSEKLGVSYSVEEELKGESLAGKEYEHPFAEQNGIYAELKREMLNVHTVLLSTEYVDTSAGTGLVHCAPGCGPEDYEVGHRNGIRPFNTIDEHGYCRNLDPFTGLRAKENDDTFISMIKDRGALVHTHTYAHDYPFGERSKKPVIFRTTKQWFLKVEDMKDELIKENNEIAWVPDAAYNAFNSWLENLRDNSISRQRYWGTPLPIWRNTENSDDCIVVGSANELASLSGADEPEDLHIPTVDTIEIVKDGKTYRRVPDVLDVWVDAGVASWNCLDYPAREDNFALFPADFILEGKDQVRGWFNLLHVASMVALGKKSFKACYMHGFVNDAQGRKMSKSLGNYILPEEVTGKYGVDATRYYMISAANPGYDMNYNFEDLEVKFRNLIVFWNTHNYLLDLCESNDIVPEEIRAQLGLEEKYILARLQSTIKGVTEALDSYRLNEAPGIVEEFLLDLSRTYIQMTRETASAGTDEEKTVLASVLLRCLRQGMALLAPVCPYFAERVYLNMKERFPTLCPEESIHLCAWPAVDTDCVNDKLIGEMAVAKDVIAAILEARDKARIGTRWPVREVRVSSARAEIESMSDLIKSQTNVKELSFESVDVSFSITPNFRNLGKTFGTDTGTVAELIKKHQKALLPLRLDPEKAVQLDGFDIRQEHLAFAQIVPERWALGQAEKLDVYLDTTQTPDLEEEGLAREITRRIQQLRKEAGLVKKDRIDVALGTKDATVKAAVEAHKTEILERTGTLEFSVSEKAVGSEYKVKGASFSVEIVKK